MSRTQRAASLDRLAAQDGTFRMVAIDQRDTLRRLLRNAGRSDDDAAVREFKAAVIGALSSTASAVLTDPEFGLPAFRSLDDPPCGLLISVENLEIVEGRIVGSRLDESLFAGPARLAGADALKFLVMWPDDRDDRAVEECVAKLAEFVDRCRDLNVASVIETIMLEPAESPLNDAEFNRRLIAAAQAIGDLHPELYKTQVPNRGRGGDDVIAAVAGRMTDAVRCPWVVLSAGVGAEAFPDAVRGACRGGASGFLSGQAVWGPSLRTENIKADLCGPASARLDLLSRVVAEHGRPWTQAHGGSG